MKEFSCCKGEGLSWAKRYTTFSICYIIHTLLVIGDLVIGDLVIGDLVISDLVISDW